MKRLLMLLCLFPSMLTAQRPGDDVPPDRGGRQMPPRVEQLRERLRLHRDGARPMLRGEQGPGPEQGAPRGRPGRNLPPAGPGFGAGRRPGQGMQGRAEGRRQGQPEGPRAEVPRRARLMQARLHLMELRIRMLERRLHRGEQGRPADGQRPPQGERPHRPRGQRQQRRVPREQSAPPAPDERA